MISRTPRLFTLVALLIGLCMTVGMPSVSGAPKADKNLKRRLLRALKAGKADLAASHIRNLGKLDSFEAGKIIMKVGLGVDAFNFSPADTNTIFDAAKRALAGMKNPKTKKEVKKQALGHKKKEVRVMLLGVVALDTTAEGDETLIQALGDRHAPCVFAAIEALAKRQKKPVVDALIEAVLKHEKEQGRIWGDLQRALNALTGESFLEGKDWDSWWDAQREKYKFGRRKKGKVGTTKARNKPKLFGEVSIISNRALFVLDVSGSMAVKDPNKEQERAKVDKDKLPKERERLYRLKIELRKLINTLNRRVRFNLITFGSQVNAWKAKKLQSSSPANKASAIKFIEGMNALGFTRTDLALERAFEYEANTIYILTDGIPQKEKGSYIDTEEILEWVRDANKTRKIQINTIGFSKDADYKFMKKLAEQNGGTFTPVK